MSATERLRMIQNILHLFFSNKIKEAEAAVEPYKNTCQHFSHAKIQFVTISALLTLDPVSNIFCDHAHYCLSRWEHVGQCRT